MGINIKYLVGMRKSLSGIECREKQEVYPGDTCQTLASPSDQSSYHQE